MYAGVSCIAPSALKLTNLVVLNLFHNNISTLENIPASCVELYLDFNQISEIKMGKADQCKVELLSISHNLLTDRQLNKICTRMKQLRCLNVSHNQLVDIRQFVSSIKECPKLKMLTVKNNPVSMLGIYFTYITN